MDGNVHYVSSLCTQMVLPPREWNMFQPAAAAVAPILEEGAPNLLLLQKTDRLKVTTTAAYLNRNQTSD